MRVSEGVPMVRPIRRGLLAAGRLHLDGRLASLLLYLFDLFLFRFLRDFFLYYASLLRTGQVLQHFGTLFELSHRESPRLFVFLQD